MEQIRFAEDTIKELTPERIEAIKTYTSLQLQYTELAKKWLCRYFIIKYLKNEVDIDALSETQMTRLDNCKDTKTREKFKATLPHTDVPYDAYCISPFTIEETTSKCIIPIDYIDTYIIEEINTRIKTRLNLYSNLI